MGGYPHVAQVISADLGRLAQARPGDPIRFARVTLAEARRLDLEARRGSPREAGAGRLGGGRRVDRRAIELAGSGGDRVNRRGGVGKEGRLAPVIFPVRRGRLLRPTPAKFQGSPDAERPSDAANDAPARGGSRS